MNMNILKPLLLSFVLSLACIGQVVAGDTVNINTADAATLERVLHNVGATKAEAIVEYRKANGAFKSIEQLALVSGIGLKTVERNRERIVVTAPEAERQQVGTAKPVARSN